MNFNIKVKKIKVSYNFAVSDWSGMRCYLRTTNRQDLLDDGYVLTWNVYLKYKIPIGRSIIKMMKFKGVRYLMN